MARIASCLLIVVVVGGVLSAPAAPQEEVRLVRYELSYPENGNYKYTYYLSNGQVHTETGTSTNVNGADSDPVVTVVGAYAFVAPDGETYWVEYTADENGYHPMVGQGLGMISKLLQSSVG